MYLTVVKIDNVNNQIIKIMWNKRKNNTIQNKLEKEEKGGKEQIWQVEHKKQLVGLTVLY